MKRLAALAIALFTMASARDAYALEAEPEVVLSYVSGGRWHDDRPDSLVVGGGVYAGVDLRRVAFGVASHFYGSPSFGGNSFAAELGGYVRGNLLHLELDRYINIQAFLRGDLYYRTATRNYTEGVVPYVHLGLRLGGVEVTTGGALETAQGGKIGGMLVWSLGFDVIEIGSLISHLCAMGKPQPP